MLLKKIGREKRICIIGDSLILYILFTIFAVYVVFQL